MFIFHALVYVAGTYDTYDDTDDTIRPYEILHAS